MLLEASAMMLPGANCSAFSTASSAFSPSAPGPAARHEHLGRVDDIMRGVELFIMLLLGLVAVAPQGSNRSPTRAK